MTSNPQSPLEPPSPQRPNRMRITGIVCLAVGIAIFALDAIFELEHVHPLIPPILALLLTVFGVVSVGISYIKLRKRRQ